MIITYILIEIVIVSSLIVIAIQSNTINNLEAESETWENLYFYMVEQEEKSYRGQFYKWDK